MRVFSVLAVLAFLVFGGAGAVFAAENIEQLRAEAEQGDAEAQNNLGVAYANGRGVPQDDTQAVAWFRKAAEQGNAEAQNNLGGMYHLGRGVPQDDTQAYMWVNLAAAQGDEHAIKIRDFAVKNFTPSQIEEGQRLAREWLAAHPQARGE